MKKRIKKAIAVLFSMFFAVLSLGMMSGCNEKELPRHEEGYFQYSVDEWQGEKFAYIVGLTALGKEQEYLIFPSTIGGYDVADIGYTIDRFPGHEDIGGIYSKKLKKIFFSLEYKIHGIVIGSIMGEKILINETTDGMTLINANITLGYNFILNSRLISLRKYAYNSRKVANVSYMYNFEEAPNSGWYWADSYDQSTIEFIPPEPEREGYMFAGWYREPECVNAWDFDNDITEEEIVLEPYNNDVKWLKESYPGTYLYAKWEPIE